MSKAYFTSDQLNKFNHQLDLECAELERRYGYVTASQRNELAARIISEAVNAPAPDDTLKALFGASRIG